tara:strand:+ start:2945 stop:3556 length:612 start_codon:yes stop_codon:yes gene_type:complete
MKNKSLQECLNYIQVNLKVPKNRVNSYQNYKYRNLDDIFEGLKPLLDETGCVVTCSDGVELIGDRVYIKSIVTIQKGEESESCLAYAREPEEKKGNDVAQISGTSSSYARKYALSGLFICDDCVDVDSMDNSYTVTDEQKTRYQELLNSGAYKGEKNNINKWWKGFTTFEQAEKAIGHMEKHVDKIVGDKEQNANEQQSLIKE